MTQRTHIDASSSPTSGVRAVRMRTSGATMRRLPSGEHLITPDETLRPYPKVLTDRLQHWAKTAPQRICIAKRGADDLWRCLTYEQVWNSIRSIGQALLDRGLSVERPVAILSENDLEHFLLTYAGQHVGVPVAPISPPYSLVSKDFGKLRHALKTITPEWFSFQTGCVTLRRSKPLLANTS